MLGFWPTVFINFFILLTVNCLLAEIKNYFCVFFKALKYSHLDPRSGKLAN